MYLDSTFKSRDITLPTKVCLVRATIVPVVMYGCESWTVKKAEHWRIDAFELWYWRRLESPLDYKEIQPVHSKGNQSWVFIGRTDAEAETPILWSLMWRVDSDAGRDWGQEEKVMTEDEMAGWHHWLDGHESEWTPGVGDGQGGLACCDSWGHKELDMTEKLIWSDLRHFLHKHPSFLLSFHKCQTCTALWRLFLSTPSPSSSVLHKCYPPKAFVLLTHFSVSFLGDLNWHTLTEIPFS